MSDERLLSMEKELLGDDAKSPLASYVQRNESDALARREEQLLAPEEPIEESKEMAHPVLGAVDEESSWFTKAYDEYKKANPMTVASVEGVVGVAKGIAQATEETANFAIEAADFIENSLAGMGVGSGDLISSESRIDFFKKKFENPTSTVEQAGKVIGQFIGPLALVNKAVKAKGLWGIGKNIAASAGISGLIMDPEEKRLSDLIQANPALANPITEILASDKDDSRLESRLKNVFEAALFDVGAMAGVKLGESVFKGVKVYKSARKIRADEAAQAGVKPKVLDEEALKAQEVKINSEIEAASVYKEPPKAGGPKGGGGGPKGGGGGSDIPSQATTMRELVEEFKATNRPIVAEDLHRVAKRGKITDEKNLELAKRISEDEARIEAIFDRKFGTALAQEERTALKLDYMVKQLEIENFTAGVDDVSKLTNAELAVFQERLNNLQAVSASIDAASSESGRALRSATKKASSVLDGPNAKVSKKVEEYIKLHGGIQDISETIAGIKNIQNSKASVLDILEHQSKSVGMKFADAAFEVWVNSILSGFKTLFVTNPVSNAAIHTGMRVEGMIAEGLGRLWGNGVVPGEVIAFQRGFADSLAEATLGFKNTFKKGVEVPKDSRARFFLQRKKAISADSFELDPGSLPGKVADIAGHVINLPTQVLTAQDAFFSTISNRARLSQIAHRMSMQRIKALKNAGEVVPEGMYDSLVKGYMEKPTKGMLLEAERFAGESTLMSPLGNEQGIGFGDFSITGKSIESLSKFLNKWPTGRYWGAFMRIGTNIVDRTLQRTPISFLRPETRANLFRGTAASAQEEIAKMTFGTGVLATAASLSYTLGMTGGGPKNPKSKRALKSTGWQEYSLPLGKGGYIPLKDFGSYGELLKISADISELLGRQDDENLHMDDELVYAGVSLIANAFTPEQLSNGVPKMFDLIKKAGEGSLSMEEVSKEAGQFTKGFVPFSGVLRDVKDITNPGRFDTSVSGDGGRLFSAWEKIKNEFTAATDIFGYGDLPSELNMFGEEVFSPIGIGGSIKSAIFSNNMDNNDPVVKELVRLSMSDPVFTVESPNEDSLSLRMPERTKRKGVGFGDGTTVPVSLSPQQYHDYVKLSAGHKVGDFSVGGPLLKDAIGDLIGSDTYKDLSEDAKKVEIKRLVSDYRSRAWQLMLMQPDILEEVSNKAEQRMNRRMKSAGGGTIFDSEGQ